MAAALQRARDNGPLLRGISVGGQDWGSLALKAWQVRAEVYCFPSVGEKRELPMLVAAAGGTWLSSKNGR